MRQQTINVPSGDEYIIREQTGADDDTLSKMTLDEADTINTHLANIIVKGPKGKRLTLADVEKLPLRDKYMILLKSRIFSLSNLLIFNYKWDQTANGNGQEYSVDLNDYVWDYSKPLPVPGDEDYNEDRILPCPTEKGEKYTLASGKVVSFDPLDGEGEKYLLKLKDSERTINKQLIARGFKVFDDVKFVTVKNFQLFSAKDMMEIRNLLKEKDPLVLADTVIVDPDSGQSLKLAVITIRDFYYPEKI